MANGFGWIKVYRKVQDRNGYFDESFCRNMAWIDLLLLANHENNFFRVRGIRVDVKRGQIGWTTENLGGRWKWSRGKVVRFLKELEIDGQIVQQKNNVTTLISILNYNKYQSRSTADESTDDTTDSTTDSTTDGHREEVKEYKEVKNPSTESAEIFKKSQQEKMVVLEMMKVWFKHNPNYFEEKELDYSACLAIAYKIAKMKKWKQEEVLNGKMQDTLVSWDKVSGFVRTDGFLQKLSLTNLNNQWQNLVQKMNNKNEVPADKVKEQEKAFMKSLGL